MVLNSFLLRHFFHYISECHFLPYKILQFQKYIVERSIFQQFDTGKMVCSLYRSRKYQTLSAMLYLLQEPDIAAMFGLPNHLSSALIVQNCLHGLERDELFSTWPALSHQCSITSLSLINRCLYGKCLNKLYSLFLLVQTFYS